MHDLSREALESALATTRDLLDVFRHPRHESLRARAQSIAMDLRFALDCDRHEDAPPLAATVEDAEHPWMASAFATEAN